MTRMAMIGILWAALGFWAPPAAAQPAAKPPDLTRHPACPHCGMDREKFAHSRMLISYSDGSEFGACSLHCAALELAVRLEKNPVSLQVADYNTKKLVDAEKAAWVIGGAKPGVMTRVAKWAFEQEADALAFIRDHQGKLATFDDAMRATFEDMYEDVKMIRARRAKLGGTPPKQD
ncbi:MAG: nitrous oxide reductase accessory protein NosL [Syntrophobacterales bacterium]|nr:nitrous oxide reductase accessory protein NosL [Syntrophobacterales bacterium]